jgi:glycogen synthase
MPRRYISRSRWAKFLGSRRPVVLYDDPSTNGLVAAVRRALAAMALPGWDALRDRAMRLNVSWSGPARRYERVYRG